MSHLKWCDIELGNMQIVGVLGWFMHEIRFYDWSVNRFQHSLWFSNGPDLSLTKFHLVCYQKQRHFTLREDGHRWIGDNFNLAADTVVQMLENS